MLINIKELTNFKTNHSEIAEQNIMDTVCNAYNLKAGNITTGKFSDYDFDIEGKTFELKISSKSTTNSVMELSRANGAPSGLTATTADFHMFLNNAGNIGKLRLIRTSELQQYYTKNTQGIYLTETRGDKIGSKLAPLNFKQFNDLMILEMPYNQSMKQFDTNRSKTNSWAQRNIHKFLNRR